eukprot:scaffold4119_cov118-Isochrysis_galbana.AAC.4
MHAPKLVWASRHALLAPHLPSRSLDRGLGPAVSTGATRKREYPAMWLPSTTRPLVLREGLVDQLESRDATHLARSTTDAPPNRRAARPAPQLPRPVVAPEAEAQHDGSDRPVHPALEGVQHTLLVQAGRVAKQEEESSDHQQPG